MLSSILVFAFNLYSGIYLFIGVIFNILPNSLLQLKYKLHILDFSVHVQCNKNKLFRKPNFLEFQALK